MSEIEALVVCENCDSEVMDEEAVTLDNDAVWCQECVDHDSDYCIHCDYHLPADQLTVTGDGWVCDSCLEEYYSRCDHCDDWVYSEDAICDDLHFLCEYCYREYYVSCHECGRIMREHRAIFHRDENYYCESCVPQLGIHNYSYKPDPVFYGSGTKYLGLELEVQAPDDENDYDTMNDVAAELSSRYKEIYCKEDSSTGGFEIVTHPCTVDYLLNNFDWKGLTSYLLSEGYVSHSTRDGVSCGLHIHVSRRHFGDTYEAQDGNIAKLLYLVEKFWPQMLKLSRRTPAQIERWANRYCAEGECPDRIGPERLLARGKEWGRYYAINLENRHTVEFRLWRGSLKVNTIRATIQLVDVLTDLAVEKDVQELQAMTWSELRDYLAERGQELATYLEERGL